MKKYLFLMLPAVLCLFACNKGGNKPVEQPVNTDEPVALVLGTNMRSVQLTKGVGALESWSGKEDLYIYGIERTADGLVFDAPFVDNVKAASPESSSSGAIKLWNPAITDPADPTYKEPFYYGENNKYDFFGYYVDNAAQFNQGKPVVEVNEDGISVDITINGTQDILAGRAHKDLDILADASSAVTVDKAYSAFAARRHVQPNIVFKHKLSRFIFKIRSGTEDVATKVSLAGLSVESKTSGKMIIAAEGASDEEDIIDPATPAFLPLYITSASGLVLLTPDNAIHAPAVGVDYELPGSIMVMPGDAVYNLKLTLVQTGATLEDGIPRDYPINFENITGGTQNHFAEPGYQYVITVVVYGLESVEVNVTLEQWQEGGTTVIDPDVIEDEQD